MTKDVLEFVEEAAKVFEENWELSTYKNKEYIALRFGLCDDCIKVISIGEEVGFFEQWIKQPKPKDAIDYAIKLLQQRSYSLELNDLYKLEVLIRDTMNKE